MESELEKVFAVLLFMVGISQISEPARWAAFYEWVLDQGPKGRAIYAAFNGAIGLLIVTQHNVWDGVGMLLTLLGWGVLIDALAAALMPAQAMTSFMVAASGQARRLFRAVGFVLLVMSTALAANAWGA